MRKSHKHFFYIDKEKLLKHKQFTIVFAWFVLFFSFVFLLLWKLSFGIFDWYRKLTEGVDCSEVNTEKQHRGK